MAGSLNPPPPRSIPCCSCIPGPPRHAGGSPRGCAPREQELCPPGPSPLGAGTAGSGEALGRRGARAVPSARVSGEVFLPHRGREVSPRVQLLAGSRAWDGVT